MTLSHKKSSRSRFEASKRVPKKVPKSKKNASKKQQKAQLACVKGHSMSLRKESVTAYVCGCKERPYPSCSEKGSNVYETGVRAIPSYFHACFGGRTRYGSLPTGNSFLCHNVEYRTFSGALKTLLCVCVCVFVSQPTLVHTCDVKLGLCVRVQREAISFL